MKKIIGSLSGMAVLWALPVLMVNAQAGGGTDSGGFINGYDDTPLSYVVTALTTLIQDILVPLVLILCFVAFLWGVFLYFVAGGGNEEKRETGKSFMIYAIAGFVMIAVLWAVVAFVTGTIGLTQGGTAVSAPQPVLTD